MGFLSLGTSMRGCHGRFRRGAPPRAPPYSLSSMIGSIEHDPEKWVPVFGKDHAPRKTESAMTNEGEVIAL
jgi:hypothetical protein